MVELSSIVLSTFFVWNDLWSMNHDMLQVENYPATAYSCCVSVRFAFISRLKFIQKSWTRFGFVWRPDQHTRHTWQHPFQRFKEIWYCNELLKLVSIILSYFFNIPLYLFFKINIINFILFLKFFLLLPGRTPEGIELWIMNNSAE